MASCNSFPTLTSTTQVVTNSLSTSTTSHVTTLPPSTTTITLTPTCTASNSSCPPITAVSTIPGGISTVVDTVTITVPVTSSQVTTLWGSSCSSTNPNAPTPPTPAPTPSDTSTPPPPPSLSTPPPSVFVMSSSSTAANGAVSVVILTTTSTAPPILVTPTVSAAASPNSSSNSSRSLGPIIGGVVGGVVGLCALIFLAWFFIRRKQRWDDIFDHDVPVVDASTNNITKKEKRPDSGPSPYQYGLVGHTKTSSLTTPPSSPPLGAATRLDGGMDHSHHRNNSTTPLLSLATGKIGHGLNTSSPRPPSSSSAVGIGSQVNVNTQGQVWDPRGFHNNTFQPFSGSSTTGSVGPIATTIGRSDGDNRAGSPVSFQEQRILQVTNADLHPLSPLSPQNPESGPSFFTNTPSTDPQRDGKGRIMTKGGKAPIVHLDGGRYQERAAGSSSVAGPAPPAYSE